MLNFIDLGLTSESLVVSTVADESDSDYSVGDLSLREAIQSANNFAGAATITFDPAVFSSPQTITFDSELSIADSVSILGPGNDLLTLDGDGDSRLFRVESGNTRITGVTMTNGWTSGDGGAIRVDDGASLVLVGAVLASNSAVDDAGALSVGTGGTALIEDSTFTGNVAFDSSQTETNVGGAIANSGDLTLRNVTIDNNSAGFGGAIWSNANLDIDHSTLSGNTASSGGGAIWASGESSTTTLDNSTVTQNSAPQAAAIRKLESSSTVAAFNTILSGNSGAPSNLVGSGFTGDHNLLGAADTIAGSGNVVADDPQLGPLQDNGGPTFTHVPLQGSAAIDAGLAQTLGSELGSLDTLLRFDEVHGSTVAPSAGTLAGTIVGDVQRGVAPDGSLGGSALEFNGGYVQLDDVLPFDDFTFRHTIEARVNVPSTATGRVGAILGNYDNSSVPQSNWEIHDDGQLRIYWNDGEVDLFGTTDLRDGQWHHVAFVRSSFSFKAYIDGVEETLSGPTSNTDGADLTFTTTHRIGGDNRANPGIPFQGAIDELAFHTWELDASEIAARAAAGVPQFVDQRDAERVFGNAIDIGSVERQVIDPIIDPDFNDDGMIDGVDIDLLQANIVSGPADPGTFDLDGDGDVDIADRDAWLVQAGSVNLPSGNAYLSGDANLDGTVDGQDFVAWNNNKFSDVSDWTGGDFNSDGVVDGVDFVTWNNNKFQTADSVLRRPDEDEDRDQGGELSAIEFVFGRMAESNVTHV